MKVTNEYYQFFGELAIALQTKDIKMSFKTLNKVLADNGLEPYGSSRAVASGLSAAYREWERQEKANGLAREDVIKLSNNEQHPTIDMPRDKQQLPFVVVAR